MPFGERDISYIEGLGAGPTERIGALAMGSAPTPGPDLAARFGTVVLCAKEYQPRSLGPSDAHPIILRARLDDSGPPPTQEELKEAFRTAAEVAARLRAGRRVLVTCMAGRNRSGLVTGLALMGLGYTAKEVITKIRLARESALTNVHFVRVLKMAERHRYSPRSMVEQLHAEM